MALYAEGTFTTTKSSMRLACVGGVSIATGSAMIPSTATEWLENPYNDESIFQRQSVRIHVLPDLRFHHGDHIEAFENWKGSRFQVQNTGVLFLWIDLRGVSALAACAGEELMLHPQSQYDDVKVSNAKFLLGLIPLLTSSGDGQGGSSFATGQSDDELSTNYGGLDLEALSRLDGRRWSSSCRSQEGLELVAVNRDGEEESMTESIRSLSQKYRPVFFEELIGQNIVVQSLMNAILRGRVASLYLFQGPRRTGKTSTARVLAAALNCLASNKTKPCGVIKDANANETSNAKLGG
ncbi:hypothetical protein RJ639_029239 [Escallonia herrerae]|uniref:Uncharacterized protein n=1 Tax=Escallonia herrerae TaxID=1293975 RepID=A0AA88XIH7_9ASTE|nr:hypothetical protein RJ639_029239 [Escallonia herrerae]